MEPIRVTVASSAEYTLEVLGSRFVACVAPVADTAAAVAHLAEVRTLHPDASHHCWAYRVGQESRFSDDGEPGGTAGRPMLEVILKRGLDGCAAVVARYFGGRKLGAGGLVRAYSSAVAKALDRAGETRLVEYHRLRVTAPYAHASSVLRELVDAEAGFDASGLTTQVSVAAAAVPRLTRRIADLTRGEGEVTLVAIEEGPEPT